MFQVSPGINVSEVDLTSSVPIISVSEAAIAGVFRWGPVDKRVLIGTENNLFNNFGKPTNFNAETWFTAASFLSYGNQLYVVRVANTTSTNSSIASHSAAAVDSGGAVTNAVLHIVKNADDYETKSANFESDVLYIAKYPGEMGNSLRISVCDSANAFSQNLSIISSANIVSTSNLTITAGGGNTATVYVGFTGAGDITSAQTSANTTKNQLSVGDLVKVGNTELGTQYLKITALSNVTSNSTIAQFTISFKDNYRLHTTYSSNTIQKYWEFFNVVDTAPGTSPYVTEFGNSSANDELHVVVVDDNGLFTGTPGAILEVYKDLSRATDAKTEDGASNYYKTVINEQSNYVWWSADRTGAVSNTAVNVTSASTNTAYNAAFAGGSDGYDEDDVTIASLATGYDKFASAGDVDVSYILCGKIRTTDGTYGETLPNYIIDNICETRKDCIAFYSPPKSHVVNNVNDEANDMIQLRNSVRSSSYGITDSGYKYMYDKYNDVYRYIPLNGDIAGLCSRTDTTNDPWWSPAGFNRGQIKNIIKLAYNPSKADRDLLYKNGINPVVSFPGQGTVLYGDKTLLNKPSAFNRINVRRLFIVLEKSIATYAQTVLFDFNDEFTRAQFKNKIVPYLRDIQGRRGITDFLVVCDDTNNTAEVIDRNEFIGDIYIKPARSINFIQLNFVAVRTGVAFSEIVGNF